MVPMLMVFIGPNNLLAFQTQTLNILIWVDQHEYQQVDYRYHMHQVLVKQDRKFPLNMVEAHSSDTK